MGGGGKGRNRGRNNVFGVAIASIRRKETDTAETTLTQKRPNRSVFQVDKQQQFLDEEIRRKYSKIIVTYRCYGLTA